MVQQKIHQSNGFSIKKLFLFQITSFTTEVADELRQNT